MAIPLDLIHGVVVRYALLSAGSSKGIALNLKMLKSSVCLSEKNFAPALFTRFGVLPTYVVYTCHVTHATVSRLLVGMLGGLRMRLINLDSDPEDCRSSYK